MQRLVAICTQLFCRYLSKQGATYQNSVAGTTPCATLQIAAAVCRYCFQTFEGHPDPVPQPNAQSWF